MEPEFGPTLVREYQLKQVQVWLAELIAGSVAGAQLVGLGLAPTVAATVGDFVENELHFMLSGLPPQWQRKVYPVPFGQPLSTQNAEVEQLFAQLVQYYQPRVEVW